MTFNDRVAGMLLLPFAAIACVAGPKANAPVPPTLASSIPATGATGVLRNLPIKSVFSSNLDPSSVSVLLDNASNAYSTLVNQPSLEQPSVIRVKPGDYNGSYLYRKLTGAPGITGSQMPRNATGGPVTPLTPGQLSRVRTWIIEGAPNN